MTYRSHTYQPTAPSSRNYVTGVPGRRETTGFILGRALQTSFLDGPSNVVTQVFPAAAPDKVIRPGK
jgi:hypothetical protein